MTSCRKRELKNLKFVTDPLLTGKQKGTYNKCNLLQRSNLLQHSVVYKLNNSQQLIQK